MAKRTRTRKVSSATKSRRAFIRNTKKELKISHRAARAVLRSTEQRIGRKVKGVDVKKHPRILRQEVQKVALTQLPKPVVSQVHPTHISYDLKFEVRRGSPGFKPGKKTIRTTRVKIPIARAPRKLTTAQIQHVVQRYQAEVLPVKTLEISNIHARRARKKS